MNDRVSCPDFDTLVALHQHDAQAFESFRKHLLREAINSAPPARRPSLEQLLQRIEATREAAKTPMEAAASAFNLMMDSLQELQGSWHGASYAITELQTALLIERVRR